MKDRREKKKEEARAHNAQLHAAVSVAGVAAAVAAIAAATAAAPGKDEQSSKTDMAVASAATLVAAQCVEAAEALGAEREHLTAVVGSAVNVRSAGDMLTLTAAAATGKDPIKLPSFFELSSIGCKRMMLMDGVELCSSERGGNVESEGIEGSVEHSGRDTGGEGDGRAAREWQL